MTEQWTEGPPVEDGLYACAFGTRLQPCILRGIDGTSHYTLGPHFEASGVCTNTIIRHYRLPELVKPLELPRRFRAKIKGQDVVGVPYRRSPASMYQKYFVTSPVELCGSYCRELLDALTWENDA